MTLTSPAERTGLRVQVVYRNYIPLNSPYQTFWTHPPRDVSFDIPAPRPGLAYLYPIYARMRKAPGVSTMIRWAQRWLFATPDVASPKTDAYFFVGMLPERPLDRPYFVDIEHGSALLNFVHTERERAKLVERVMEVLLHPNCKAIVPMSHAAAGSLEYYLGAPAMRELSAKIRVIYPALPLYRDIYGPWQASRDGDDLRVLFIGNEPGRKGFFELCDAIERVERLGTRVILRAITRERPGVRRAAARLRAATLDPPRFATRELMTRFMMQADLLALPTHLDTFGMVVLEALSSGVPVVATHQFALPEIISHERDGILLQHDPLFFDRTPPEVPVTPREFVLAPDLRESIVAGLAHALLKLAESPQRRRQMGAAALDKVGVHGPFSIAARNRALRQLFGLEDPVGP